MPLIVEDGTGLNDANTYVSLATARAYCADLGLALPADDREAEAALATAVLYIDIQTFQGYRSTSQQALQWPRTGVNANGYPIASNIIPPAIWQAQVRAAVLTGEGTELVANSVDTSIVKKEKVGPIETEYSDYSALTPNGLFPTIDTLLAAFLTAKGGYKLSPQFGF